MIMTTHVRSIFKAAAIAAIAATAAVALTAAAPVSISGQTGATVDTARAPGEAPADTLLLPGLVVTATRVAVRPAAVPTPVTVLPSATLRELGIRTVAEALRTVPGAAIVQAGPRGGQTSLFLRGGQSGYVKVLVDGVPVNDPGGAIDLADLTTDQVDRIEIVRGPVSVLYGSDAVAGVVQVFTRRGHGSPSLSITTAGGMGERRHEDGRYGALDAAGTVTGSSGPLAYAVGGGRSWNDGAYPFNSDRRVDVLNGHIEWQGQAGTGVSATARFSDSDTGLPTDGAGNLVDRNARLERRTWTAGLEADQRLGSRVVARLQLGLLDRDQLAHDRPDTPADTVGTFASRLHSTVRRLGADARVDVELPRSLASAGVAVQDQRGTTAYASESEWGPYAADAEFRRGNQGYYAQLLTEPVAGLHLTAGARIDDNEIFGTFATHRLGVAYEIGQARIRGALGRAFREPTFPESFGSGFGDRGNPALVPERSRSWEVGLDGRVAGPLSAGATWFDQRFRDMIQYTFATADPDDPNYYNVGAAVARGLELSADAVMGRVRLQGSYTWLTTRVLDPGLATDASFMEGEPLVRRPAHSGAVTARYQLTGGTLGLIVHRVGERDDMDFGAGYPAPRTRLPAYTTVDLSAEQRLTTTGGAAWDLVLRIQNALDARYEAVHGFPAPGRLIALGLRMRTGGR
jgi:vitamin B12 transporter